MDRIMGSRTKGCRIPIRQILIRGKSEFATPNPWVQSKGLPNSDSARGTEQMANRNLPPHNATPTPPLKLTTLEI